MSILFASLESTDVENELDEEEDPESNQTGKKNVLLLRGNEFSSAFGGNVCILFID